MVDIHSAARTLRNASRTTSVTQDRRHRQRYPGCLRRLLRQPCVEARLSAVPRKSSINRRRRCDLLRGRSLEEQVCTDVADRPEYLVCAVCCLVLDASCSYVMPSDGNGRINGRRQVENGFMPCRGALLFRTLHSMTDNAIYNQGVR